MIAQVVQFETERISERTKEAMAAAKAREAKLGGRREEAIEANKRRSGEAVRRAEALRGVIAPMVEQELSLRSIAEALNNAGNKTERNSDWNHKTVGRVVESLELSKGKQTALSH